MNKTARTGRPTLRETQEWLRWIITDPRGVDGALENAAPGNPRLKLRARSKIGRAGLEIISDAPPVSKTERLDVYAEAYFARLLEILSTDFKATLKAAGEDAFRRLVAESLSKFPSKNFSANFAGQDFPRLLERHPILKKRPFLADLAKLEWLIVESFYSPNSKSADPALLSKLTLDGASELKLKLNPATRFLETGWTIDEYRLGRPIRNAKRKLHLAVHREKLVPQTLRLEKSERDALEKCRRGMTLGKLCAWLARNAPQAPIQTWLNRWINTELVTLEFSGK